MSISLLPKSISLVVSYGLCQPNSCFESKQTLSFAIFFVVPPPSPPYHICNILSCLISKTSDPSKCYMLMSRGFHKMWQDEMSYIWWLQTLLFWTNLFSYLSTICTIFVIHFHPRFYISEQIQVMTIIQVQRARDF